MQPWAGRSNVSAIRPVKAPSLPPQRALTGLCDALSRNPGAPSQDFLLSDPVVASHVTGNMPEQVSLSERSLLPHAVSRLHTGGPRCDAVSGSAGLRTERGLIRLLIAAAQIHMTQGATPSAMYISWVTGNASYTYCSQDDNATCGDATNACYCNASPPAFASSQVKYSTDEGLQNAMIGQEAGDYPVTVRSAPCLAPPPPSSSCDRRELPRLALRRFSPCPAHVMS